MGSNPKLLFFGPCSLYHRGCLLGMKEWESAPGIVACSWPHSSLSFRYNGGVKTLTQDRNFVVRIQSQCHNHISPPAHSERLQEVTWQCVEPRSVLCVCGYMHLLSCRQGGVIQSCSPWSVLQPAQETLLAPLNNFITKSKTHEPHQGYARSLS